MRAHFASDIGPASPDADDDAKQTQPEQQQQGEGPSQSAALLLEERINEFKRDSANMSVVTEFVEEVLEKAETEARKQQNAENKTSQQNKDKGNRSNFKNGKVVNRARGFMVRLFDAICNCANTAAAPAQRLKLRSGKRSSTSGTNAKGDKAEKPSKRNAKGKDNKKDDTKEVPAADTLELDEHQQKDEQQVSSEIGGEALEEKQ